MKKWILARLVLTSLENMPSDISLGTWNIQGLHHKVRAEKIKNKDFIDNISQVDFMVLTETWIKQNLDIHGF